MKTRIQNQLILMSDEHTRHVLGCYGNSVVQTPNLDRLAASGTIFTEAYTPVPICVPARAAFATGHYGHVTRHWDNATPYTGTPPSWGHALQKAGLSVGSIGKLHYRNPDDSVGLDFQKIPMHVVNGVGDVLGCVREPLPKRWKSRAMAENIGPGETSYTAYDRSIADAAVEWLWERAEDEEPWTLFVSMVTPHFPLVSPEKYYEIYASLDLMPEKPIPLNEHEWHRAMRDCILYDNFTPESTKIALASYYGLVSFMDAQMGRVLNALDECGLCDQTQIIYTSDHGDNIGERGLWGKSNLFEESVGVPMIIAGPDIPKGRICRTPVSLIDIFPTVLKTAGLPLPSDRPGRSLSDISTEANDPDRVIFAEYHAMGASSGAFMIRKGSWKLVYYVGMKPELYNLEIDPKELTDLGDDPRYSSVRESLVLELGRICDPEEVHARAIADQTAIIDLHGGPDFIVSRGGFGATPPPGESPLFLGS